MATRTIDDWFMQNVLPLEPMLTRFLQRNWRDEAEISDLRQEAYARVYEAAQRELPLQVKPFLFQTAILARQPHGGGLLCVFSGHRAASGTCCSAGLRP